MRTTFPLDDQASLRRFAEETWPHRVVFLGTRLAAKAEHRVWCTRQFGPFGNAAIPKRPLATHVTFDDDAAWVDSGWDVRFKLPSHAVAFKIRWS